MADGGARAATGKIADRSPLPSVAETRIDAMDLDTIKNLASEVAQHLDPYTWIFLMLGAAAVGAFGGRFLRTRGKNLATKTDFDDIRTQLRATKELAETIKAEVSHKDWSKREWTNLRRRKLEELLNKMHDCQEYLERQRTKALAGEPLLEENPHHKFDTIATLYFPELRKETDIFSLHYRECIGAGLNLAREIHRAGQDMSARTAAFNSYKAKFSPDVLKFTPDVLHAAEDLKTEARELLVKIMDAER